MFNTSLSGYVYLLFIILFFTLFLFSYFVIVALSYRRRHVMCEKRERSAAQASNVSNLLIKNKTKYLKNFLEYC